jgi:hypothetical protein
MNFRFYAIKSVISEGPLVGFVLVTSLFLKCFKHLLETIIMQPHAKYSFLYRATQKIKYNI